MAKPSLPTSREERARAYLNVLFEINSRLKFIRSLKPLDLPHGIAREVCYLQLRHVCELVAIGCLVIQGDYKSASSFTGEYNPQKVFRDLGKLYEGFFPQPAVVTKNENGDVIDILGQPNPEAITRRELEALWSQTGGFLHRLRLHNFFRPETWEDTDIWPEVDAYVSKIESLLNPHIMPMHKPKILVVAGLDGDRGKPNLAFVIYGEGNRADILHFHGRGETPFWRDS